MANTETSVTELKINKLTKAQYEGIVSPSNTELYFVKDEAIDYNDLANTPNLASVALSGDYDDLINVPEIDQSDWNQTDTEAIDFIKNKPNLANVAISGSYPDLINKPTIPTTTDNVSQGSTAALTSGGAYTNLVTTVEAGNTADKINITKNGTVSTITVNNVANATNATTASKLGSTTVGSTSRPIYINNGTATQISYTIEKSVPADAKFTDTTYGVFTGATSSADGASGLVKKPVIGDQDKFLKGDGTWSVVDSFPSQSGNSGKFLTTNGTTVNWASLTTSNISDITATAAELNVLDGITASTTELNYTDGVTSNIQTQLNNKVSKSGDSMTNNLEMTNGSVYLEGIGSSASGSTSKLVLGTPTNTYAYLTGNTSGAFGIYSETSGTRKGIACYPNQNFFADATTKTIDLGRSNNVWKTGYIDTLSDGTNSISIANIINKVTANTAITGATKCKITYDSKGLVTAGADLEESDIPNLHLSKISDVTASATELNYVDGVTSNIQTQLNAKAADSNVVHKTGNETISGTKSFVNAPQFRTNLTPSTNTQKESTVESTLIETSLNTDNDIDGLSVVRFELTNGDREVRYRAGFKNSNGTVNLWPSVAPGVDANNTTYVFLRGDYAKGPTPTEDTTSSIQIDTVGARNTKLQSYQPLLVSGTNIKTINSNSLLGSGNIVIDGLPAQTGNSGKYLTTNGTSASWNTLATVATSGSYSDLSNKPTISDLVTTTQLAALNSGANTTNIGQIATNTSAISTINGKIPSQASTSNQLADKAFVNSTVQTNAANFRGAWSDWAEVPTSASSYPQDYTGSSTPTVNDYLVVQDASDYGTTYYAWTDDIYGNPSVYTLSSTPQVGDDVYNYTSGEFVVFDQITKINSSTEFRHTDGMGGKVDATRDSTADLTVDALEGTWRFKYTSTWSTSGKSGWIPEYQVNETPMTAAQLAALNSGITSTLVGYLSNVTSDIQTQLNGKQASITGGASTITSSNLTANRSLISNGSGKVAVSDTTSTELGYVHGVTSAIQTQIDSKLNKLTYEWNNAISFGSTGKLCIGKFCCYDSNITIDIDATTSTTYHGTLVIALQNMGTSGGGQMVATVYGDAANTIAPNLYIYKHGANDCLVEVYFSPLAWSKNIIHIRAVTLNKDHGSVSYDSVAFDLCTSVSEIPAEATIKPTNALDSKQATLVSGTNIKTINNNSILGSGNLTVDGLPSQSGQSGKYLTTNGTTASWTTVNVLPSQSGNSGKYLTTNGTTASWVAIEEYTANEVETLWNSI